MIVAWVEGGYSSSSRTRETEDFVLTPLGRATSLVAPPYFQRSVKNEEDASRP